MIVTVTLNPAFDHLLFLPETILGRLNRAPQTVRMPGGKGVNVASALAILGEEVIATGFLGGQGSRAFEESLRKLKVTTNFTYIDHEIRTDFYLIEEKKNRQTLVIEKGSSVDLRFLNSFKAGFERIISSASAVVIGGSLPSGVAPNFVRELILVAEKKKVKVILNVTETILNDCFNGISPFLVCPDLRESGTVYGIDIKDEKTCQEAAAGLFDKGAEIVLLNYGLLKYYAAAKGEAFAGETELDESTVMIGVDDSVLAGFVYKYLETKKIGEALKYGLGAGLSTSKNRMNYPASKNEVEELLLMAKVRKVD